MAKLDEQAKNLQKLQQLANQLDQAQQTLAKGDTKKAAEALGMGAATTAGHGQAAPGDGVTRQRPGRPAGRQERHDRRPDEPARRRASASSASTGTTARPERPRPRPGPRRSPRGPRLHRLYNTKVAQQYKKGKAIVEGTSPFNRPMKGLSVIDVQGEVNAAEGLNAEALTNQKIPKNVEKHIRGYFDQINKGQDEPSIELGPPHDLRGASGCR